MPSNPEQRRLLRFLTKVVKEKRGITYGMSNSIIEAHCLSTARDPLKKCTPADILLCKASTVPAFVTAELLASTYFAGSSCFPSLSVDTTGDLGSTGLPASSSGATPGTPRALSSSSAAHSEGLLVDTTGGRDAETPPAIVSPSTLHSEKLSVDTTGGGDAETPPATVLPSSLHSEELSVDTTGGRHDEGTLSPAQRKIKSREAALCRFISAHSEDTPPIGWFLIFVRLRFCLREFDWSMQTYIFLW